MNEKLTEAISDAVEIANETGQSTCVVKRLDRCGGVLEFAIADAAVCCDIRESIVWRMP